MRTASSLSRLAREVAQRYQITVNWQEEISNELLKLILKSGRVGSGHVKSTGKTPVVRFGAIHGTPVTHGEVKVSGLPFSNHEPVIDMKVVVDITMFAGRQLIQPFFQKYVRVMGAPANIARQVWGIWSRYLEEVARHDINWRPVGANVRTAAVQDASGMWWPTSTSILEGFPFEGVISSLETFDHGAGLGLAPGVWHSPSAKEPTQADLDGVHGKRKSVQGVWGGRELRAYCAASREHPFLHVSRVETFNPSNREKISKEVVIPFKDFLVWADTAEDVTLYVSNRSSHRLSLMERLLLTAQALGIDPNDGKI
jgi:hypothetical protein